MVVQPQRNHIIKGLEQTGSSALAVLPTRAILLFNAHAGDLLQFHIVRACLSRLTVTSKRAKLKRLSV